MKHNYIVFDVETTGLPKNYNAKMSDVDNWPRIIQLAWALYDPSSYLMASSSCLIKQERPINARITKLTGITNEMLEEYGVDITKPLQDLYAVMFGKQIILAAHNMGFDYPILGAEYIRNNNHAWWEEIENKPQICTMKQSTEYCKLPSKYGKYKWPKLNELYKELFNKQLLNMHNAMFDVFATATCFFELKRLGVINDET